MPTSASQYLEKAEVKLDDQYGSALDILRRIEMKDFRIGPHLNLDNPSDELFEGCENIVDFADIDI